MDQRTTYTSIDNDATAPTIVTGRQLSRRLKKLNAGQKALLGYGLYTGALHVSTPPTKAQAAAMVGVSVSYLNTVTRASPAERELLSYGWLKLSDLHNNLRKVTTDDDVERVVVEIGPDRIMSALDRVTAPVVFVAAE